MWWSSDLYVPLGVWGSDATNGDDSDSVSEGNRSSYRVRSSSCQIGSLYCINSGSDRGKGGDGAWQREEILFAG